MNLLQNIAIQIPQIRQLRDTRDALKAENDALKSTVELLEARHQQLPSQPSPFFHYNAIFDPQAVIRRHALDVVEPSPDHYTNFMGVKVPPKVFPSHLEALKGQVEGIPIPANWHADIAEWGACLRAVELARNSFTVVEVGCGWGCWMNITGAAARRLGLKLRLIGVEGDEGHIGFAKEALADNGFTSDQIVLKRGIAAASDGVALFPRHDQPGDQYGSEPVFGATEAQQQAALDAGSHDVLPMFALGELAGDQGRIDLLHIDIQGGEGDFIDGCLPVMNEKVAYVMVGTHSRQLEGRIFDAMIGQGWELEIERPAILRLENGKPFVSVDGVQGWRNPRLDAGPSPV